MNDGIEFLCIIMIAVIGAIIVTSPMMFGSVVEKEIVVVYNDHNGLYDSCGNFYNDGSMADKTKADIGRVISVNGTPVTIKVEMLVTNKGIPYLSSFYDGNIIRGVITGNEGLNMKKC
jgi:hypothetical protein